MTKSQRTSLHLQVWGHKSLDCSLWFGSELLPSDGIQISRDLIHEWGQNGAWDGQAEPPVEVVQAWSGSSWMPSLVGFPGTSNWQETPGLDPEHARQIWPGNSLGSPRRGWKMLLGRGASGLPCLACCQHTPAPDKRKEMDGWIFTQVVWPRAIFFFLPCSACQSSLWRNWSLMCRIEWSRGSWTSPSSQFPCIWPGK